MRYFVPHKPAVVARLGIIEPLVALPLLVVQLRLHSRPDFGPVDITVPFLVEVHSVLHVELAPQGARGDAGSVTHLADMGVLREHCDVDPGGGGPPGVVV